MSALAAIPSPPNGVYHAGPLTLHMYGVMLLIAIAACVWLTGVRWVRFGGEWDLVYRVAIWGVIAGIVGARLYHVITSWHDTSHEGWYWPLAVWKGGLGVWGGILFGVLTGAWIVRRSGNSVRLFMDAVAPGLLLAQAIGRWGNWWNQELYGKHTTLPWGLEIHGKGAANTYHPTFLYEFLWNLGAFAFVIWADRKFRLGHGRVMALYVMAYTAGRVWIEMLRIDNVELKDVFGVRFNVWTSIVLFVAAAAYFVISSRRHPGREEDVYLPGRGPEDEESPSGDRPAGGVSDPVE
jgi:prolipoprotein diacylglyceryl transferase